MTKNLIPKILGEAQLQKLDQKAKAFVVSARCVRGCLRQTTKLQKSLNHGILQAQVNLKSLYKTKLQLDHLVTPKYKRQVARIYF